MTFSMRRHHKAANSLPGMNMLNYLFLRIASAKIRRSFALALIGIVAVLPFGKAHAVANCAGPTQASFSFIVPSGTYTVPRDVPVGTILTPWTDWQASSTSLWVCNFSPGGLGPVYKAAYSGMNITVLNPPTTNGGTTFTAYPTNLQGVGVIMMASNTTPDTNPPLIPGGFAIPVVSSNWVSAGIANNSGSGSGQRFGMSLKFAFVKTGPMVSGPATVSGQAASVGMDIRPIGTPSNMADVYFSGSATFKVLACTTPDVTVNLGEWTTSDFAAPGYTTNAVSFNINLNNCPAGMNSIKYWIDPVTAVVDPGRSVVALNAGGAAGMGVQLLDSTGTAPFPLSTVKVFSDYNGGTGGSYTIPLKARYYQHLPSNQVTPGPANSSMTFTMLYE